MEIGNQGFHREGAWWAKSSTPDPPRPTYVERSRKFQARVPTNSQRVHVHSNRSASSNISVPFPTNTDVHAMTWNVEGLREAAKYDAILSFCRTISVPPVCSEN